MRREVFLVPGFFGFAAIGRLQYFGHVERVLGAMLGDHGVTARLHPVPTRPTAPLADRARTLAEFVVAQEPRGPIDFVGHSTGGVDIRVMLDEDLLPPAMRARVETAISVVAPHRGTPLARVLAGAGGDALLRALSAVTLHGIRLGGVPPPFLRRLAVSMGELGSKGLPAGLLRQVYDDVLSDFGPERRAQIRAFFEHAARDSGLIRQLQPAHMQSLDRRLADPDDVRCASLVAWAEPVPPTTVPAPSGLFRALHRVVASEPLDADVEPEVELPPRANDGFVPARSQVWASVLEVAEADHLDVLGYFDGRPGHPHHVDWLRTTSGYGRDDFERTWARAVDFILARMTED